MHLESPLQMLHLVEGTMRRLNAGVLGLDRTPGELARQKAAAAAAAAAAAVAEAEAGGTFCYTFDTKSHGA